MDFNIDLEEIGYFLYMQEMEEQEKQKLKVNAESENDLVGVKATTNREKFFTEKFS